MNRAGANYDESVCLFNYSELSAKYVSTSPGNVPSFAKLTGSWAF
ncbi:hypothetical protein FAES_0381 [Fibrella aestuarina BUZ 2]|uniref:Uncharacterized protein n=1 Tax=Fibrella aestuarina BUZ 2 TaxID=1166018 RepID=I0K2P0_9BACT|nr:hypothetical protein FAES_0381 [Fibrella aestuarina BUZ 2]